MKIYCDESGFTGRNLLSKDQPYFVYSAVNMDNDEINDVFNIVSSQYPLQSGEIKGNKIVKSANGKRAILNVFEKYSKKARLVYHDKKFALAGKIVESAVEPYVTSKFHFYKSKLNVFIASGLYSFFVTKDSTAEQLFSDFENISKGKVEIDKSIIGKDISDNTLIDWLLALISTNPEYFRFEMLGNDSADRLSLDLTVTSLLGLLSEWSVYQQELEVVCDNSKVFTDNPLFEMIQNEYKRTKIVDVEIGFKLKGQITHEDSKASRGIQVADLFSSTVFYCLKNPKSLFSKEILELVQLNSICKPFSFCVVPELNLEELPYSHTYYHKYMLHILWTAQSKMK